MEWISVKDKLPKDFKNLCEQDIVLVCSLNPQQGPGPLYGIAQYNDGKWDILGNCGAHSCTGYYDLISEDIGYWANFSTPVTLELLNGR